MKLEEIDIDWLYLIERVENLIDLGEEFLNRHLADAEPDPQLFSQYLAFRWTREGSGGNLLEIADPDIPALGDLLGIDQNLQQLRRNTLQFVLGYAANNVLLWGERGTGKSSAVKGLLGECGTLGLRLIEIQKQDLFQLPLILRQLRALPYRFVLYCDDLSFAESDVSYRELKALLEGGVEARPPNVLVYATSNRRHLLPEQMRDNRGDEEIHPEEAIAEKLSLSDRFGLTLPFYAIDQEQYLSIVRHMAKLRKLRLRRHTIEAAALDWARLRGGHSGRLARQFIDDLSGRLALARHLRASRTAAQK